MAVAVEYEEKEKRNKKNWRERKGESDFHQKPKSFRPSSSRFKNSSPSVN